MGTDQVTRFARVDFHSDERVFGIKDGDRLLHVYIIGKTGTGKSTLLENMALQDLERGHGFALIDPHGDLVARIAAQVSASGRHDVIYLDATDPSHWHGVPPRVFAPRRGALRRFRSCSSTRWSIRL
ncbi:MAG: type IV secretory system conjugative DNA transfer family protein, partial [Rhodoplanes sp.]